MKFLTIIIMLLFLGASSHAEMVYRDITVDDLSNGWDMRTFSNAIGSASLEVSQGILPDGEINLVITGLQPNTAYTDLAIYSYASNTTNHLTCLGVDVTYQGSDGIVWLDFLSSSGIRVDNSNGGIGIPKAGSYRWVSYAPDFLTDASGNAIFAFVPATIGAAVQRSYIDGIAYNDPFFGVECDGLGYDDFDVSGPEGVSDCVVNFYDFAEFARHWMECVIPDGC